MRKQGLWVVILFIMVLGASAYADPLKEGDAFFFGKYEQDAKEDNGEEPIEWKVLQADEEKALIISRYVLEGEAYNESKKGVVWKDSTLREWLNGEFLDIAFTEDEQSAICVSNVSNLADEGKPEWDPVDSEDTEDMVFLLSYAEAKEYFGSKNAKKAKGTKHAGNNGAKSWGITSVAIGESDWWLRSPGKVSHDACFIDVFGAAQTKVVTENIGVRPAIWIDTTSSFEEFPYQQFSKAEELAEQGEYEEAANLLDTLGDYNDARATAGEYRYQVATRAIMSKDFDKGIELLETLDGYKDSNQMGRMARYNYAVMCQEDGDYEKAAKLYGIVGQYEDSMARMKECFEKLGISVYYFSEEAVNTGYDTGYAKADKISGSDRHFGWQLGDFFMSGFTRRAEDEDGNPIFIKTLGDSVTLWFDLEQDIAALNGNKQLFIRADSNGYDEYFGVRKSDFGKGTLIVRHADYQNKFSDPVIYTDYLLAKGTTGADTKVVLNEEGDYEVALDYEIQNDDVSKMLEKFGNYKVMIRFSIRNGNCMVFPFDVSTGEELRNSSVTENGFYLDLARSRYLDIDVKHSVITNGAAGVVEDERFNRPAKDGDQYTNEGIYTISVSNRYTGESTVKTIFVGSEELLQEYIDNGFSADRLK